MTVGVRTCPKCLMKVLPLDDGLCPACRRFNFNTSPSDEKAVAAALAAKERLARARLRAAAALHWRTVWSLVAGVGLTVARVYFAHYGTGILGEPGPDRQFVVRVTSLGVLAALAFAWRSAAALASTIQLVSGGARTPNVLTVLRESMAFFEEHHIPTGLLGPRVQALLPPPRP